MAGPGPLRGTGEETEDREGQTVHTFGWYLRKYVAETRAKGATPIVCSLIPRNIWENGKIARPRDSHADWAREVAKAQGVGLLDLHELIAGRYDSMGESVRDRLVRGPACAYYPGRRGAQCCVRHRSASQIEGEPRREI